MTGKICRTICLLFFISTLLRCVHAQEAAPDTTLPILTLAQSLNIALAKNRTLKQAQEAAYKAAGHITEVKAAGALHIDLSGGYLQRNGAYDIFPLAVGINPQTHQLIVEDIPEIFANTSSVGVTATKAVDIGGVLHAGTRSANLGAQIADLDLSSTRNTLILQVKQGYYDALRAKDLVAVADEAVKNAQIRLGIAQSLVKNGVTPKLDVFRAETSVATAQQNQIAARNAYELAKAALNNLIGREVDMPYEVQPSDEPALSDTDFPILLAEALRQRPEVVIATKNIALAKQQEIIARRGQLPDVSLSAGSTYDLLNQTDKDLVNYAAIQVDFPLYDSGQTKGRVVQAKSDSASAKINEDNVREAIALEVRQASLSQQSIREEVSSAVIAEQQASESLRVAHARYLAGVGDQLELSDAELAYTQSQQNLVNARYDLLISQARLEKALGRYAQ